MFSVLEKKLYKFLLGMSFLLMLSMVSVIFLQVISRYVFSNSLTWSEEVGRYLFVWITFLGTALAVRNRSHVALDVLIGKLPQSLKKPVIAFGYLTMMALAGVMIYAAINMITLGSRQVSAALQIPMYWVYLILPVSGVLIIFYLAKNLYEDCMQGGTED
ncbi:TRAP transporter small permease [Sporomusa sp. GT1]|uniref:Putative Tripartite ATP-independent periplasmic transporter DctQ component n=1 Tax=uncultured Sporomusa sp. TaxID=307249 RepID=A0A212LVZ0_9FIRM|nr:TRAP transporter small permease [Sporomusa sp. GT1]SCM81692.1 putative Tripartite ATP-independent periplasmic transporter DctQ component [uncultured Sporomusa sp.]